MWRLSSPKAQGNELSKAGRIIFKPTDDAAVMLNVRKAKMEDAASLAPALRMADRREIQAMTGETPYAALTRSIMWSNPCYAIVDHTERVIALFGVAPDINQAGVGSIWLLGSPEIARHSMHFLRHSRTWVDRLQEKYMTLWNYVDARNKMHIRWLKWCGFVFLKKVQDHGVEHRPFYEFERVRSKRRLI